MTTMMTTKTEPRWPQQGCAWPPIKRAFQRLKRRLFGPAPKKLPGADEMQALRQALADKYAKTTRGAS